MKLADVKHIHNDFGNYKSKTNNDKKLKLLIRMLPDNQYKSTATTTRTTLTTIGFPHYDPFKKPILIFKSLRVKPKREK